MEPNFSTHDLVTVMQHRSTPQMNFGLTDTICLSLAIALPAAVIVAIVGYRKYEAKIMRQRLERIQRLNRIWQLDSGKSLS
jgi:hypothetical protein